jgi:mannose-6-phosphate isomerase-like protein (cupin superfamily)
MRQGETIRNNQSGETLTMLVSEHESGGVYQQYEVCLPPHRPSPPLHYHVDFTETFTVREGTLDMYLGADQKHVLLYPGESATAQIAQPHRFANDRNESVTFTVTTKPAGGVVKAFQLAYGIANQNGAAQDGLPKNPLARLVFIRISQGYLPGIPLALQKVVLGCTSLVARLTGFEKRLAVHFD